MIATNILTMFVASLAPQARAVRVPDVVWRCQRPLDLSLRTWPDGCVVFDDANAQLQCFSPVAGELLTLFMQRPQWTATELAHALLGEAPTADDVEMVENRLIEFSSLNFIDRVAV